MRSILRVEERRETYDLNHGIPVLTLHPDRRWRLPRLVRLAGRYHRFLCRRVDDPHLDLDVPVLPLKVEILPHMFLLLQLGQYGFRDSKQRVEDELALDGGVVSVDMEEVAWLEGRWGRV